MATKNTKNFELKLRKTGIIVIILGMVVLLCSIFLLGVEIGKSIDEYPGKISSLPGKIFNFISQPTKINPEQILASEGSPQPEGKDQIEEIIEKSSINTTPDIIDEKKQIAVDNTNASETVEKSKTENKKIKKTEISNEKSKSSQVSKKKYIIHAASFQEKEKAYMLNRKIAALGFDPKIIPVDIKNKGKWYRVVVSGLESKAKAQSVADKISKKTGTNCIVLTTAASEKK